MPILYIMCGMPGCGKSTWARNFIREHEDVRYVSRDEIRFTLVGEEEDYFANENKVFQYFTDAIRETLVDGFDVIADATHLNRASRKKLIRALHDVDFKIIYVIFNTPYNVCLERNNAREGRCKVPEEAMASMWRRYIEPTTDEDYRCIGVIEGE